MKNPLSGLRQRLFPRYGRMSYAQEGEDILLERMLPGVKKGFYVDVGAHHPKRFSNTYLFYKRGWSGINVDAMPGSMRAFKRMRPRDQNLEVAIAETEGEMLFYIFNEPALNTFDSSLIPSREASGYHVVERRKVRTTRLERLLDENLPSGQPVHFLSIDVEGLDLQALRSNNWEKYRPRFVLSEAISSELPGIDSNPVVLFLASKGYALFAKTHNTLFFQDKQAPGW